MRMPPPPTHVTWSAADPISMRSVEVLSSRQSAAWLLVFLLHVRDHITSSSSARAARDSSEALGRPSTAQWADAPPRLLLLSALAALATPTCARRL
eukprot:2364223-Prymnesium_polylepis.2